MTNDIRRFASIAACALAISLAAIHRPITAADAAPAQPAQAGMPAAAAGTPDRAQALFDAGKYAQAKDLLDRFIAAPPAGAQPQDLQKAQQLLDRVKGILVDQYQAVETARRRAKAEEAKRAQELELREAGEKQMRADANRFLQQGQYEEATRLYNRVAADRAADAFNLAMDYYDQGQYDKTQKVLERLNKFITDQRQADPQFKSGLGVEREQRVAEYLKKLPDARENLQQGTLIAKAATAPATTPPAGPSEAQRKALQAYDEALRAFDQGRFDEARKQFEDILHSGVSLGKDKDSQLREKLNQIALRNKDVETRRAAALANMKSGEALLAKNDWRGAGEFLGKAVMDKDLLTEPQRAQLAGLLTQVADARKKAGSAAAGQTAQAQAEIEEVKRQEDYLAFVKKQQQILDQQEKTTADMYVDLAKVDFDNFRYDAALKNIEEALKHQSDNAAALNMKDEILALQGKSLGIKVYYDRVKLQQKAVVDEVVTEINLSVQRGRTAMDSKDYPKAIDQFSRALDSLDYLAPVSDIRMAESQVKGLLKQAQDAQADAEEQQKRAREYQALAEREQALRDEAERNERRKLALFAEANAEFAKGKYESAIKLASEVVATDPENGAARDLIDDARQALRRKTWDSILETDAKSVEDERVRLRMHAIFPGAIFMYPAKELWEEIKARPQVELPSGEAVKTPKVLDLEARLDQEIKAVSLPQSIVLPDAIDIIKNQVGKDVNFILDPDPKLNLAALQLQQLDLRDVTLRTLLHAMLRGQTPPLNFVISDGFIFISSAEGCRKEESRDENLSLRQYDVSDLMIIVETTGSGSGGSGSSGSSGGTSSGGSGGGGAGTQDIVHLIVLLTGRNNWPAGADPGVSGSGGSGTTGGGGGGGGGAAGGGVGGGQGAGASDSDTDKDRDGPGRLIYPVRLPWLIVNQTDRIHKKIEEVLAELRSETHMQIQIEATFMEFSDNFLKDVGVQWSNLPAWNIGSQSIFGSHISGSTATISYNQTPSASASSLGIFEMAVTFLNSSQTTLLIHAAEESTNAIITSSPHITCVNTVSESLSLTTTATYVSDYTVQSGIAVPTLATYQPDLVSLSVTPFISADRRYVTMVVNPSFGTSTLTSQDQVIPIQAIGSSGATETSVTVTIYTVTTTSNSISTTIMVPDRGTAVLGGLSHVEETREEGGVPILSHIPIIKRLFLNTVISKTREHDIFLVSPTIMLQKEYEP